MAEQPIYATIGFKCADRAAFDALWQTIRIDYRFMQDGDTPIQAFAVSAGDMFAEQDAITALVDSNADADDLREAIQLVPGNRDLTALLAEYGVTAARP